jgi:hypothetical protein
MFHLAHGQV